jgi:stage V sporulation protein R
MDPHINPPAYLEAQRRRLEERERRARSFPEAPDRDVLGFLIDHAPLRRWQSELLTIVRDEAIYFAPQGQTRIMNEGWATFWHTHLMTTEILADDEVIDYCDHHSGTVQRQPGQLNPYALGVALWRHIEARWDKGQFGRAWQDCEDPEARLAWDTGAGLGRSKIFEVRRTHNDVTFLDAFLTAEFCREQGFFTTRIDPRTKEWQLESSEFAEVKKRLLQAVASRGQPRIAVVDGDAFHRGELRLHHDHEGLDLQLDWAGQALANLARIWGRAVHLDTWVESRAFTLTHDGTELRRTPRTEDR